jgi:hypothetical protein
VQIEATASLPIPRPADLHPRFRLDAIPTTPQPVMAQHSCADKTSGIQTLARHLWCRVIFAVKGSRDIGLRDPFPCIFWVGCHNIILSDQVKRGTLDAPKKRRPGGRSGLSQPISSLISPPLPPHIAKSQGFSRSIHGVHRRSHDAHKSLNNGRRESQKCRKKRMLFAVAMRCRSG